MQALCCLLDSGRYQQLLEASRLNLQQIQQQLLQLSCASGAHAASLVEAAPTVAATHAVEHVQQASCILDTQPSGSAAVQMPAVKVDSDQATMRSTADVHQPTTTYVAQHTPQQHLQLQQQHSQQQHSQQQHPDLADSEELNSSHDVAVPAAPVHNKPGTMVVVNLTCLLLLTMIVACLLCVVLASFAKHSCANCWHLSADCTRV